MNQWIEYIEEIAPFFIRLCESRKINFWQSCQVITSRPVLFYLHRCIRISKSSSSDLEEVDQRLCCTYCIYNVLSCCVQFYMFVEITGISKFVMAKITFQRLVTCVCPNVDPYFLEYILLQNIHLYPTSHLAMSLAIVSTSVINYS